MTTTEGMFEGLPEAFNIVQGPGTFDIAAALLLQGHMHRVIFTVESREMKRKRQMLAYIFSVEQCVQGHRENFILKGKIGFRERAAFQVDYAALFYTTERNGTLFLASSDNENIVANLLR